MSTKADMKVIRLNKETGYHETIDVVAGTDATISIGSDSYAATVVRTTPKTIYVSTDNNKERVMPFRLSKGGYWVHKGYYFLTLGEKENYRDPSF